MKTERHILKLSIQARMLGIVSTAVEDISLKWKKFDENVVPLFLQKCLPIFYLNIPKL